MSIAWEQQSQPNRVKLVWQERGGPMVSPPKQKGFGSHLIERAFETRPSAREAQRLTARLLR